MTLEEAIKEYQRGLQIGLPLVYLSPEAARLGIEALEREKLYRQRLTDMKADNDIELLPSESEEERRVPYYASSEWRGEYIEEEK